MAFGRYTLPLRPGVEGDHITLTIFCLNDAGHTQTVYTAAEKIASEAAICTSEGSETYRMSYEFEGQSHVLESVEAYTLPKLPRAWGEWRTVQEGEAGTVYERECTVCGQTEQSDHKHTYVFPDEAQWTVVNDSGWLCAIR